MFAYLPDAPTFAAYALAVTALAITPGPDMTLFLSQTIARSRLAGLVTFAGALLGIVIHSAAVAVGLSALLLASATAFTVLKIMGAIYLLYLAIEALRGGSGFSLPDKPQGEARFMSLFSKGLLINLLNPKIVVFFITFLPQFVSAQDADAAPKLFVLGILFALLAAPIGVAMILCAGSLARVLKRSRRVARAIDYLFAAVLGGFAIKLLATRA